MIENLPDEQLVERIKNKSCAESLEVIVARHSALFNKIYSKFSAPLFAVGVSRRDAFDERIILFYEAAKTYSNDKKAKFTTYFANFARWHFLNRINHTQKLPIVDNRGAVDHIQIEIRRDYSPFFMQLPNLIKQFKDKRIQKIYTLRYLNPGKTLKWREIASEMNLSVQTCSKLHKRGIEQLKSAVEKIEVLA